MKKLMTAAVLAASAFVVTAASANAFKKLEMVGDWQVAINENMGPGCLIAQEYPDVNAQVQMGIDATSAERTGYMAIYVKGADAVAEGEIIPAKFDVDGEIFEGTFVGQKDKGYDGAWVPVNNTKFVYDLAAKQTLTIDYREGYKVIVDLTGTADAFEAMRACQEGL